MEQDFYDGLKLIAKAREEKDRREHWQLYCSIYPHFDKESFVPWDKFYKKQTKTVNRKSTSQIKAEKTKLDKLFAKG